LFLFRPLFCLIGFVSTNLILSGAAKPAELLRNLPLTFEENQGQTDRSVLFTASTPGAKLFLTRQGVTFATGSGEKRSALRLSVVGSNPNSDLVGERQTEATSSFFRGSDPSKWVKGARQFGAVRVQNVRPGIDLVYYGNGQELEYDIVLRPGAQPDQLRLQFEGADHLSLDKGDLIVRFAAGTMTQHKPTVWQEKREKGSR